MEDDANGGTDDDDNVVEDGGGASGAMIKMDLMMKNDDLISRGGPKSGTRKTSRHRAAKKIKLGNVITNYFNLDGEKSQGI